MSNEYEETMMGNDETLVYAPRVTDYSSEQAWTEYSVGFTWHDEEQRYGEYRAFLAGYEWMSQELESNKEVLANIKLQLREAEGR